MLKEDLLLPNLYNGEVRVGLLDYELLARKKDLALGFRGSRVEGLLACKKDLVRLRIEPLNVTMSIIPLRPGTALLCMLQGIVVAAADSCD